MSGPVDVAQAADVAILRRLGRKYRSGRATPDEAAAFEAANDRQMARQRGVQTQVRSWRDLPIARACWEGDARQYMRLHKYADQVWADDLAAALARVQGGAA